MERDMLKTLLVCVAVLMVAGLAIWGLVVLCRLEVVSLEILDKSWKFEIKIQEWKQVEHSRVEFAIRC